MCSSGTYWLQAPPTSGSELGRSSLAVEGIGDEGAGTSRTSCQTTVAWLAVVKTPGYQRALDQLEYFPVVDTLTYVWPLRLPFTMATYGVVIFYVTG